MSRRPYRKRNCNKLSQFRWTSTKVILTEKTSAGYNSMMTQGFKRGGKKKSRRSLTYPFFSLSSNSKPQLGAPAQTWRQYSMHGSKVTSWRKKLHWTNEDSNFLGSSFSNRDNVITPIQFRESQTQHHKRWFLFKNRPSIFTSIAPVLLDRQTKSVELLQYWNQQATLCPNQQCLIHHIQVQKPILVVATDHSSIISIDNNITDKIIRSLMYDRKIVGRKMEPGGTPE